MIRCIEKAYNAVENNRPSTHSRIFYATQGILLCKNQVINSAKVICRFHSLRIVLSNRLTSHMSIGKVPAAHAFNYIVLRVKSGLTSCEDLATALPITILCWCQNMLLGLTIVLLTICLDIICIASSLLTHRPHLSWHHYHHSFYSF